MSAKQLKSGKPKSRPIPSRLFETATMTLPHCCALSARVQSPAGSKTTLQVPVFADIVDDLFRMSTTSEPSDSLFAKAVQGDKNAIEELLEVTTPQVLAKDGIAASDAVVQETVEVASLKFASFIKALENNVRTQNEIGLETWLREIGHDVSLLDQARNGIEETVRERALVELVTSKVIAAVSTIDGLEKHAPDIEAEDVVQVSCFESIKDFKEFTGNLAAFEGWVHRNAKNTFLDFIRMRDRIKRKEIPPEALERMLWNPSGPKTNLEVQEMQQKTKTRFQQLPPIYAQVLTLHCLEELEPEEIAKGLPLLPDGRRRSAPNVYLLLCRGRQMLAKKFGCGPDFFKTLKDIDVNLGK